MSVFEAERLLKAYRQGNNSPVAEPVTRTEQVHLSYKYRDKALDWIPNPRTPMSHFYNQVYESSSIKKCILFGYIQKRFSEEFHKEARRQYTSTPRSWEGEEENTAAEEHRKPIHSWLPTEGEPHIKAPWFQHYNNESNWFKWNR